MAELLKESIFDNDQIKDTKQMIKDVQYFIEEVDFNVKNKVAIDKAKEKKEETVEVSESFSKMPDNAADFKPVAFKLKKRTETEITGGKNLDVE